MTKNAKTVTFIVIATVLIVALALISRDLWLRSSRYVHCADGVHPMIDIRDFTTQYWAYSAKLEVRISDKAQVSTGLSPNMLAEVTQGLQEAREFRKYVVAGYNACAISQVDYARIGSQFHALDGLAQEIDSLLSKASLSAAEHAKLAQLMAQYGEMAKRLGP